MKINTNTDSIGDNNADTKMVIKIFNFNQMGPHQCQDTAEFTFGEILNTKAGSQISVVGKKGIKFTFNDIQIRKRASFIDYIKGGCEIGLQIAIDFTASNGDVNQPGSRHSLNMDQNQYNKAIKAVGDILKYYDTDQMYPAYGFGAKLYPTNSDQIKGRGQVSHCFALNGNIYDPEVEGIEGVIEAYQKALHNVDLYGPTNFSPLIEYVKGYCKQQEKEMSQHDQKYTILLILTDGAIHDYQATVDSIVSGSNLPLSIVIVGIGNEDFSNMDKLDGDIDPLYSNTLQKYTESDIVNFIPFEEYKHSLEKLTKQVLLEIPRQFTDYFGRNNIHPNPPKGERSLETNTSRNGLMGDTDEVYMCNDGATEEFYKQRMI